jgi:hypothetical protein
MGMDTVPERAPIDDGRVGMGQDPKTGRFLPGNKGGPGNNAEAQRIQAYRRAFLKALKPRDVRRAVLKLANLAAAGESWAVKELLDRGLGKSHEVMHVDITHEGDLRRGEELLGIIESQHKPEQEPAE